MSKQHYAVQCADYLTSARPDRESAERLLASIEQGSQCREVHTIVEVGPNEEGGSRR